MQGRFKKIISALIIYALFMPLGIKTVHADLNASVNFYAKDGTDYSRVLKLTGSERYFYNNKLNSVVDEGDWNAHFDFGTNTLTLQNYDFGPIYLAWFDDESQKDITIILKGDNKITINTSRIFRDVHRASLSISKSQVQLWKLQLNQISMVH